MWTAPNATRAFDGSMVIHGQRITCTVRDSVHFDVRLAHYPHQFMLVSQVGVDAQVSFTEKAAAASNGAGDPVPEAAQSIDVDVDAAV